MEKKSTRKTEPPKSGGKKKEAMAVQGVSPLDSRKLENSQKRDDEDQNKMKRSQTLKERMSQEYDFSIEDSKSIFHFLLKNGKIKLPPCKRPEEEGKTNDVKYCIYHRVKSNGIKDCWVFKNKVQELLDNGIITLAKEDKKVTTNMVSFTLEVSDNQLEFPPCKKKREMLSFAW
ncbi:hypothetical protein AAC387_Pa03g1412 [Persea americana]